MFEDLLEEHRPSLEIITLAFDGMQLYKVYIQKAIFPFMLRIDAVFITERDHVHHFADREYHQRGKL